ncbi:hydrophobic protein [Streptomyces sp. SID14478]|uniref:hydrophobic protein n=1 Tax=Streptomyces sp. SID14478 TaxID=2706073 RepID=UPI001EF320CB|nr:hydrophobic protein [Streptomyces sp. SID14478]
MLILLVFGLGFTVQILWWVAAVLPVVWIAGFALRNRREGRRNAHRSGRRHSRSSSHG